jgi:hypothetical protein
VPLVAESSMPQPDLNLALDSSTLGDIASALEVRVSSQATTRLQHGIQKPKVYTDGIIRYNFLVSPCIDHDALSDSRWKSAMYNEYVALMKNKTWHLVPQKHRANVIDYKWVYRVNKKADGRIDRYKARLVAKRFK